MLRQATSTNSHLYRAVELNFMKHAEKTLNV